MPADVMPARAKRDATANAVKGALLSIPRGDNDSSCEGSQGLSGAGFRMTQSGERPPRGLAIDISQCCYRRACHELNRRGIIPSCGARLESCCGTSINKCGLLDLK
jgi:hypothetical protein